MSHHPAEHECGPRAEWIIHNLEQERRRLLDHVAELELSLEQARRDVEAAREHAVAFFHAAMDEAPGIVP